MCSMQSITNFTSYPLADYEALVGADEMTQVYSAAQPLQGKKIYEINATATGGGVAELLSAQMPMYTQLGIDAKWLVVPPNDDFFATTKTLHNCLQGQGTPPNAAQLESYTEYLHTASRGIPPDGDIYVLHDPQTLGLAPHLKEKSLIWRCHIDLTQAESSILAWVEQYYQYFDKIIFSIESYAAGADPQKVAIVHPSINPLSPKNIPLANEVIQTALQKFEIPSNTPYLLQVSRFDKFKDPLGVIEIFRDSQKTIPDLHCVLVGGYATDDPEGLPYFKKVQDAIKGSTAKNIHLITDANDTQVNALQRAAAVVIQNSTREGFGLTVTEALWKEKLVFARPVGGIVLQVIDNQTGKYLSEDNHASALAIAEAILEPSRYTHITKQAKAYVQKNFLLTQMVQAYLQVYASALS